MIRHDLTGSASGKKTRLKRTGSARRLLRLLMSTAAVVALAGLALFVRETAGSVSAHEISTPAPNGVSPWLYSESWKLTNSYGQNLHCDWGDLGSGKCAPDGTGTHLNQYYALDFANGCNRKLWPIWDGMKVTLIGKSHSSSTVKDMIRMEKTISGIRYRLTYFHLNKINVSVGVTVNTFGKEMGYSGDQGLATGCHLHMFIERYNPSNGKWYTVPPQFCGRTYSPSKAGTWFKGC